MSRGLDATFRNAIDNNSFRLATLIKFYFGAGEDLYYTDYGSDLVDDEGDTYLASDYLVDISDIQEAGALKSDEMTITFSGAGSRWAPALFLSDSRFNDLVQIKRAVVGSDGVIDSEFQFYRGRIKSFAITDSGTESEVAVNVASHWADFEKVNCRRTNLKSQQYYFSSDLGFEYAHVIVEDLRWGRE